MAVLRLTNVTKSFTRRNRGKATRVIAIADIHLSVHAGETVSIVGPSGSGKSTLLLQALRLSRWESGTIEWEGYPVQSIQESKLRHRRQRMQIIFQDSAAALDRRHTAQHLLEQPLIAHRIPKSEWQSRIEEALKVVDLEQRLLTFRSRELSGGQLQRLAIARALILRPAFIACDEITSALDPQRAAMVMELLACIQKRDRVALLISTHDVLQTRNYSHRTYVLHRGRIVEHGLSTRIIDNPLHPFTKALVTAACRPMQYLQYVRNTRSTAPHHDRSALPGSYLTTSNTADGGCSYRADCPYAQNICRESRPELRMMEEGHEVACHFPLDMSLTARENERSGRL